MKRLSLLCVLLLLSVTVACTEPDEEGKEVVSEVSTENISEVSTENISEVSSENISEVSSENISEEEGKTLQEAFLDGTGCIYFHNYNHIYYQQHQ